MSPGWESQKAVYMLTEEASRATSVCSVLHLLVKCLTTKLRANEKTNAYASRPSCCMQNEKLLVSKYQRKIKHMSKSVDIMYILLQI